MKNATQAEREALRTELLSMEAEDLALRDRLAAEAGSLEGYRPEMAALHERNADRLAAMLDAHGWPGANLVGDDGARAAWRIAQHALGRPALMQRCLVLLSQAATEGQAPWWQVAYLVDHIRTLGGAPQVYGTQFDWDADGQMSPLPIEDPEAVDELRRRMGLEPLAERLRQARLQAGSERRPDDLQARRREFEAWAKSAGWRR